MKRFAMVLTLLSLVGPARAADPPALVNYQGVLRDAAGKPRTGSFDMTFRFFDAQNLGNEILIDAHTGGGGNPVVVTGGLFNTQLGGGTVVDGFGPGVYTSLAGVFRDHGTVWMDITVNGETLSPRVRVQSSAYALNASSLQGRAAAEFLDTSGTSQSKAGRLTLADPSASSGYGLEVSTPAVAAVYGHHSGGGAAGYLGYNTFGVWGEGAFTGGYFHDTDASGSAYIGYGHSGLQANGNISGGEFSDNSGNAATIAGFGNGVSGTGSSVGLTGNGGSYGVTGYSYFGTGGHFSNGSSDGNALLAVGSTGVQGSGSGAGGYFYGPGAGRASVGAGNYGVDAIGQYPAAGGRFNDAAYSGEASLAIGDEGVFAQGTWAGGEFSNPGTGSYAFLAPNHWAGNTAGYFYNPGAPYGEFYLGVYTYIGSANFGNSSSGIYTNGGKNFVQNHPLDPGRAIVYTALEGGEAGTYTRGSATIRDGEARVPLDPTFALTTNPDIGLTAIITPRGQWSDLYVESVTTDEIVIRARDASAGDVDFDFMVNGLRLGFENAATIIPKELVPNSPVPMMEDTEARLAEMPEDSRASTPLARFGGMEAARGGPVRPLDLTRARALIAGIDAPEQAIAARQAPISLPPGAPGMAPLSAAADHPSPLGAQLWRAPGPVAVDLGEGAAVPAPADGASPTAAPPPVFEPLPANTFLVTVGESVEAGELLTNDPLAPGSARRAALASDPGVLGIVGGPEDRVWSGSAPVALSGTVVICRVDAGYGSIRPNDLLVASPTPGHAMRAGDEPRAGTIVAKALEELPAGTGTIRVLVMAR